MSWTEAGVSCPSVQLLHVYVNIDDNGRMVDDAFTGVYIIIINMSLTPFFDGKINLYITESTVNVLDVHVSLSRKR